MDLETMEDHGHYYPLLSGLCLFVQLIVNLYLYQQIIHNNSKT